MSDKPAIYDTPSSASLSLSGLLSIYSSLGVSRIIFKQLSPNDNSKNQPYLAGHLTDLGFLPTGEISASISTSGKTSNLKRKVKYTAPLDLSWISSEGAIYPAPKSKSNLLPTVS